MIQLTFRICCFFTLLLALQMPGVALAHEGPPRIELNYPQISSGAELEVRGVNIAAELPVTLTLVGADKDYALGTAVGDVHGDFVVGVQLPAEAQAGAYTVRAFAANRVMVSTPLTLLGGTIEQEGGQRDQDEPLLAPMPSPLSATAAPPRPAAPVSPISVPTPAAPPRSLPAWLFVAVAAIVLAGGALLALRRRASL
jgi:hypothetical protein